MASQGLLHARYGALGVIGDDRALKHFITVGIDGELAKRMGSSQSRVAKMEAGDPGVTNSSLQRSRAACL